MGLGRVLHWRMVNRFFARAGRGREAERGRIHYDTVSGRYPADLTRSNPIPFHKGHGANRQLLSRWDFDRVS